MIDLIENFLDKLENLLKQIGTILLVLMVIVIGGQIFCRYFLNFTPRWSEDVALISMVWFSFLGIAIGVRRGIHLSIEFFVNLMSEEHRYKIRIINSVLTTYFGYILLTRGYLLTKMTLHSKISSLGIPTSFIYGVVPITGFFIMSFACFNIILTLNNKK